MLRYSLFLLAVCGTVATAIAAVTPASQDIDTDGRNMTVIEKNQAFPYLGPLIVEPCAVEDCSDVQS
jgi:hypothetical protein